MDHNIGNRYSKKQYATALRRIEAELKPKQRAMLRAHVHAPRREMSISRLAKAAGYAGPTAVHSQYGMVGRLLGEALQHSPEPDYWTRLVGDGYRDRTGEVYWEMHQGLAEALRELGWA